MGVPQPKGRKRKALDPEAYKALCKQVMTRDGFRCRNVQCKRRDGLHVHHIVFRSQGGSDTTENMVTVCHDCHNKIHDLDANVLLIVKGVAGATEANANVGLRFVTKEKTCTSIDSLPSTNSCPLKVQNPTSPKPSTRKKKSPLSL